MSVNKNPMYQFDKQKPRNRDKPQEPEYPDLHKGVSYLDVNAVAPSPSRDYFRLQVNSTHVNLTEWQISHRPRAIPLDHSVLLCNYAHEPNLVSEVARIFGKQTADYVMGLSLGKMDWIVRLPTKILARIMEFVGIRNLDKLAPVCKRFQEISSGNTLWSGFYRTYARGGYVSEETKRHANYLGWKTTFFINRLQDRVFPGKKVRLGLVKEQPEKEFLEAQARRVKEKRAEVFQRGTVSSTGLYQYSSKPEAIKPFKPTIPSNFTSRIPEAPATLKDFMPKGASGLPIRKSSEIRAVLRQQKSKRSFDF